MAYPAHFDSFLKIFREKSNQRQQKEIKRLSVNDREELLRSVHPDHREGAMIELQVGPNKGEKAPKELFDILHAYSLIDPARFDLSSPTLETDVLVVGGGGGGASAALLAQESGSEVILSTKLRLGDANTVMAEGGIGAATRREDSPVMHYLDTMGGGLFYNVPEIVQVLVYEAPKVVDWLADLGVMFDPDEEGFKSSFAGGHSRKRVISCKDLSGLEMMRVLRDEIWNRNIKVLEFSPVVELLLDDQNRCAGALMLNLETNAYITVKAKAVILATGGLGRLHIQKFPTTNHYGATADGLVLAYRAGASLLHQDSVQYHPTGAAWPEQMLGQLITEALRGRGAHLVNKHGERFINELETRDTTTSAILRECSVRGNGIVTPTGTQGVWLDTTIVPDINTEFIGIYQRFSKYGIDPSKVPILVFPTQHYQNGGIRIREHGETDIPGLFAAGEVTGGVQGKNRLGGNSLVDIFVFGRRAGVAAAEYSREVQLGSLTLAHIKSYHEQLEQLGVEKSKRSPLLLPDYVGTTNK